MEKKILHYIADAHMPFHCDNRALGSTAKQKTHGAVEDVWGKQVSDLFHAKKILKEPPRIYLIRYIISVMKNKPTKLPKWFKIGVLVKYYGYGNPVKVLEINKRDGTWTSDDSGNKDVYSLGEVKKFWKQKKDWLSLNDVEKSKLEIKSDSTRIE
jgi:hypothetical protein